MKKIITASIILFSNLVPLTGFCQNRDAIIKNIGLQLKTNQTSITKVLSSDSLMYLHSLTPFREVIRANATDRMITMVSASEPGTRITVRGLVTDKNGIPRIGILIYVYQTSDKGWYSDTGAHILINSGDINHARLFAYLKTNDLGEFSFVTIKPKGYPGSDLAAHIHIHFWSANMQPLRGPGELQFDDDPRMTAARRKRSLAEGYLISKNSGTDQRPVYEYRLITE